jgi:hypothetical protein
MVGSSTAAYKKLYPKVAKELLIGNKVTIQYSKINLDTSSEQEIDNTDINKNDILEKLSEINGNVQVINAKLDGRNIV